MEVLPMAIVNNGITFLLHFTATESFGAKLESLRGEGNRNYGLLLKLAEERRCHPLVQVPGDI